VKAIAVAPTSLCCSSIHSGIVAARRSGPSSRSRPRSDTRA
jgi:hypothetical protein